MRFVGALERKLRAHADEHDFCFATVFHELQCGSYAAWDELMTELQCADVTTPVVGEQDPVILERVMDGLRHLDDRPPREMGNMGCWSPTQAKAMTSGAFKDMSSRLGFVMAEHPAWQPTDAGCRRVFALADGGRYLLVVRGHELVSHALAAGNSEPCLDTFTLPRAVLSEVPELATALSSLGPVVRFRNADLWDAIGTGIIRQVIRAGQAKKLYRAFCEAYGERVELPNGETYALFPSPETVMGLETDQFVSIGMAFKRRPLKSAAEVYLEQGARWRQLSPVALMAALQEVPRIGPWTAHATVADWSNDWALYSYADLAVRTWATRAAPSHHWPTEEAAFGRAWRTLAGDHLCSVTLLTLAWGSQHGDIG